jgi:hypothetical protein
MSIPEVSEGESLSSWMYRIALQGECNRHDEVSCIGKFEGGQAGTDVILSVADDPDFLETNMELPYFINHHGISKDRLTEKFGPCEQPLVPIQYRRSYCYACLEEGLKTTRSFVCKLEWRYLLQPFCSAHRVLLRDASGEYCTNKDFGLRLFISHHNRVRVFDQYDLACEADSELLTLSWEVQRRYMDLRQRAPHSEAAQQLDNFMLTLMRVMLLPCFHASYRNVDMSGWCGPDCFPKHGQSFYVKFYFEIYRVSCSARARALYLSGLLLGWIEPGDAKTARGRDYYMVTDRAQIWNTIEKNSRLGRWFHQQLELYETSLLGTSDMGVQARCGSE